VSHVFSGKNDTYIGLSITTGLETLYIQSEKDISLTMSWRL
jgi:hypothetical protein